MLVKDLSLNTVAPRQIIRAIYENGKIKRGEIGTHRKKPISISGSSCEQNQQTQSHSPIVS